VNQEALPDLSMRGRVCLVTGATAGIGRVIALELATKGATVILVGRSQEKLEETISEINRLTGSNNLDYIKADLSSFIEVKRLAKAFRQRYNKLHVLVNNAGALFMRHALTVDGIEMSWGLNHFGYFWLTGLLLDVLKESQPSRIVNVSSDAHKRSSLAEPPILKAKNRGFTTYADTKLANLFFTYQLAYILKSTGVTVNACHPGVVATNFGSNNGFVGNIIQGYAKFLGVTAEVGASTAVHLACAPELYKTTGKYFVKNRETTSSKLSYDAQASSRFWQWSLDVSRSLGMDTRAMER
jgi:NAD(P)-dependent dehydrogenase (short-subunit alcohol dehydrogenase family)